MASYKKMKIFHLTTEQKIEKSQDELFSFFSDAHNLAKITPPWLEFRVLTPAPIEMKVGTQIDYRLKLRGIPVRWQSEITAWNPPHHFVDEQRSGPYRRWIHTHTFVAVPDGTLVRDEVEYAVLGGWLVQKLFVAPDLEKIFAYRSEKLKALIGLPAQTV